MGSSCPCICHNDTKYMSKQHLISIDEMSMQDFENDAEFIPLLTPEDEKEMENAELPEVLPILPLRNTVLFPGVVVPISAGRDKSIKLLKEAQKKGLEIGVVAQRDETIEDPTGDEIFHIGTVARILKTLTMPDGNTMVILQGKKRFQIKEIITESPFMRAKVDSFNEIKPKEKDKEFLTLIETIKEISTNIIQASPNIPSEATFAIKNIDSSSFLVNFVSSNMNLTTTEKQQLLEISDLKDRAFETLKNLNTEFQKLELKNDIQSRVKVDLDQQQREYFLQQQMRTIQEELGGVSHDKEIEDMRAKAKTKKWSKKIGESFEKELAKLQRTNPQSPDFGIQRNYLEFMLDLPWDSFSKDNFDLKRAQKILDNDHYGLEDVKKRIIEHLAVLKLRNDMKSPILCLTGPPGVGKTSVGKSIAKALGREYVRMSLGGLRDEAEIRGHRKTYIGAMPGRILNLIKKAGTSNPVFVLDEIDKLSNSHHGDPSSALLEVLDPEQNKEFYDNFLELGYDLSKVMFIATSNTMNTIQPALVDRMEVIQMSGYTIEEKVEIAKKHLFPKQLKEHGLKIKDLSIDKKEIETLIDGYTRESGVRKLEQRLAQVIRHAAKSIAMEEPYNLKVTNDDILDTLKSPRFRKQSESNDIAGVVTGLAWTSVGGDILFIESIVSAGKGTFTYTGNMGNVMKESATIAMHIIKAHADFLKLPKEIFEKYSVHLHVPDGSTPKDGPSAGIAMITSIASILTQRKVKKGIAMTGEITLRGKVTPVGGIKEKILAAKRVNIKEIILCEENRKDIEEINPNYIKGMTFQYVNHVKEVLDLALMNQKVTNPFIFDLKTDELKKN